MSSISSARALGALLRKPRVAVFLGGRFVAAVGVWSERLAIGWLIWDRSQSTGLLGAAIFIRLAPAIVLSPVGGILADRYGAVGILRWTHALNGAVAVALVLFSAHLPIAAIFAATFALGIVQSLAAAPFKSVVPQVMPRSDLAAVIPLSSATFNLAAFVGPAVAGGLIALAGPAAAFAVSSIGCLVFVLVLRRFADTDVSRSGPAPGMWREFAAAVAYARTDPALRPILMLHIAAALCLRPFIDLLPAFVGSAGEGGAAMLGLATSGIGGGAVLGALWMALLPGGDLARRLLVSTAVAVACLLTLAATGFSGLALGFVLAFGLAMVVRATATLTLIQIVAPDDLRGRLAGLYSMTIRGGTALGAALIGLVAAPLGLRLALAGAAAVCLMLLMVQWRAISGLKLPAGGDDADAHV